MLREIEINQPAGWETDGILVGLSPVAELRFGFISSSYPARSADNADC
jgi:hypothetical protein